MLEWTGARRARRWILALAVALGAAAPAAAETGGAAATPSAAEVERIVREYLLREPEVIYEALQELQRRQTAAAAEQQKQAIAASRDELLHDPASPVAGNPEGPVTLVEFFDYRCQYCRRVLPTMRALLDQDDELRVVFKELPVLGEDSLRAARAALASRHQERYLDFHMALMEATDLSQAGIMAVARSVGLDPERLARDMEAPEIEQAIQANYLLAGRLGIEGTPAFVIGDQLVPGAASREQLETLIEQARAG